MLQEYDSPTTTPTEKAAAPISQLTNKSVQNCLQKLIQIQSKKNWEISQYDENSIFYSEFAFETDYDTLFTRINEYVLNNEFIVCENLQENENYFIGGLMLFDEAIRAESCLLAPNYIAKVYCAC